MLLLKRHLVELVRAGKKRQTIRLWTRSMLRPGQISYTPGLGKMLITAVDELPGLHALTEADAHADGFPSLKHLMAEIHRIYGAGIPKGRHVFRIKFEWPAPGEPAPEPPPKTAPANRRKGESATRKISPAKPNPANSMTPADREKLRAFLVAKAPGK